MAADPSPAGARLGLVLAAVLWSLGSLFIRLFGEPTPLGTEAPRLGALAVAFYRGLFGGLILLALVRRRDVRFRPVMVPMVVTFAAMSGLYLSALDLGPAGNAIFLQNTAPVWVTVFGVFVLGEPAGRRDWQAVLLGAAGAVVIVAGSWPRDLPPAEQRREVLVLLMGLGSGVVYAGVVLFLRALRDVAPAWLIALNLLGSAAGLGLFVLLTDGPAEFRAWVVTPTPRQFALLAAYGAVQMAAPYWLFSRGLRAVSPQEAGIITLIEPLLNPLWAYLITPEKDAPTGPMVAGGSLILAALVWRYMPRRGRAAPLPPSG
ncbi:MAG: DMT family transporter [Gemmataceae bacterium]|nr:DMT family transporter [Gemmataceae bacterium]